jgi:hypothetical protein
MMRERIATVHRADQSNDGRQPVAFGDHS